MSSPLRTRAIRLAHANPALRPHLLRVLKATEGDKEAEEDKAARFTEGPEGKKEFDAWIKKQPAEVQKDWEANKDKYQDKFKSAAGRLFATAAAERYAGCEKLPNEKMQQLCEDKKKDKGDDKEASLRAATIRLAHENPKLRPHLLHLLQS